MLIKLAKAIIIVLFFGIIVSCENNEEIIENSATKIDYVNDSICFDKYVKVFDKTKENNLMLQLSCNDEYLLEQYISNTEFLISPILEKPTLDVRNNSVVINNDRKKNDFKEKKRIVISLKILGLNFRDEVKGFKLKINSIGNSLKSSSSTMVYYETYFDCQYADYVVIQSYNSTLYCDSEWWYCWSCPRHKTGWFYLSAGEYFADYHEDCYWQRVKVVQSETSSYDVDFYYSSPPTGTDCPMGSYDGANCFVGTAPTGSQAFKYGGYFYYSANSPSECTYPGSTWDGANCRVDEITSDCNPFIWSNSWYCEPLPAFGF